MRSEGFPFIVWRSGGWTRVRFVCCVASRSRSVVARCVVNSMPCGSAFRARRACAVCGAVPWGLLLGRSCGCRCAVGICVSGASRVACVALCHGDCCWAGRVGAAVPRGSASRARRVCGVCGAVPWGLLLGRSCGWRPVLGIASRARGVCGVCGAVPWGLLVGGSRGWCWAVEIAAGRVAPCLGDC